MGGAQPDAQRAHLHADSPLRSSWELASDQACKRCQSRFLTNKASLKCTKDDCKSTFDNIYKICLMCSDGTSELEFIIFDQRAQLLIGKPVHVLEKKYDRFEIPQEVQNLVGQKFTFIVRLSTKRSIENPVPSFEVMRTKQQHGRQSDSSSSHKPDGNLSVITGSTMKANLKPLIPIRSNEIPKQDTPRSCIPDDTELDLMDIENQDDDTKHNASMTKRPFPDSQDLPMAKKQKQ